MRGIRFLMSVFFLASFSLGCHSTAVISPNVGMMKSPNPLATAVPVEVRREKLVERLRDGGALNSIRLVEVFKGAGNPNPYPEYRMFDIQQGGVFDLLGIRNGDILVSAHGYSVPSVSKFVEYVNVLPGESSSQIEIIRQKRSLILSLAFTE